MLQLYLRLLGPVLWWAQLLFRFVLNLAAIDQHLTSESAVSGGSRTATGALVPELGHFDVEVAEPGAHDAADGAHGHEDGHVP